MRKQYVWDKVRMKHIYHIWYEYFDVEKSIRQIAKETGHDRATVKKYVEKKILNEVKKVVH